MRRGFHVLSFVLSTVVVAALTTSPAYSATDYITPGPTADASGNYSVTTGTFNAFKVVPTSTATIEYATAAMDTAAATGYRIVVYADAGGQPGNVVGELSQTSAGSSSVTYAGSVLMCSGTPYWVAFRGSSVGYLSNLNRSSGTQTSPWGWVATGTNHVFTLNSGASWTQRTQTLLPRATIGGSAASDAACNTTGSSAAAAPAPWLQSYARNASETCLTGWHGSWAEWAVSRTGGSVCNRTIYWNGSAWMQNPSAVWGVMNPNENSVWDGF